MDRPYKIRGATWIANCWTNHLHYVFEATMSQTPISAWRDLMDRRADSVYQIKFNTLEIDRLQAQTECRKHTQHAALWEQSRTARRRLHVAPVSAGRPTLQAVAGSS